MTSIQEPSYIAELKALFETPRTLRSMKYTSWSKTNKSEMGFTSQHIKIKAEHKQTAMFELGKAVSEGGDLSKELLEKFVFSELAELAYEDQEQRLYKPRPTWCCEAVWNAELKKHNLAPTHDEDVGEWRTTFYKTVRLINLKKDKEKCKNLIKNHFGKIEEMERKMADLNVEIKNVIEKYDALQAKMVERYGIKSMSFEERMNAEIVENNNDVPHFDSYNFTILCSKSWFVKEIKRLGTKEKLSADQDSVVELKFVKKYTNGEINMWKWGSLPLTTEVKENENSYYILRTRSIACVENVFLKKGVELPSFTKRPKDNTLFIPEMFNIIDKNEKLYTEGLKGEKDRKSAVQNAFEPYEECGIEVMYVRLGYKSNGAKNGNRNRANLECLKHTYKQNRCGEKWDEKKAKYVKDKTKTTPTTKDEFCRILYKL